MSEMLNKVQLHQLKTRRTKRRLTILHKAIYGHLSLPVNNLLQPVQRLSRHLNNKAFNTIHASKNCYKYSCFPRTIRDWNSLPDAIVNIPKPSSSSSSSSSCRRSRSDKDCFHHLTVALHLSLCCESDVQESIFMSLSFRFLLMVSLNRRRGRPLFL